MLIIVVVVILILIVVQEEMNDERPHDVGPDSIIRISINILRSDDDGDDSGGLLLQQQEGGQREPSPFPFRCCGCCGCCGCFRARGGGSTAITTRGGGGGAGAGEARGLHGPQEEGLSLRHGPLPSPLLTGDQSLL